MIKYLKTEVNSEIIKSLLKRYMIIYKNSIAVPLKLKAYIKDNYKVDFNELVNEIIANVEVKQKEKNLLEIWIRDKSIKETKLLNLAQLIEYGNINIAPYKYYSKLLNKSILAVKSNLGGM